MIKKPSTIVMKYMQKYGFKEVIPVNPSAKGQKILGEEFLKNLKILKLLLILWMFLDHQLKLISMQKRENVKIGAIKVLWLTW